ncbi:unannotated protein [freshwater metagenome]|uniref:Unannotated protein n=1 Tax=freshwater metagenome TaxID=449393 RepID=A0A6J7D0G3_9ZZZZ|nr:DUF3090 family protein [Actinomycetota bacterium]
MGVYFQFDEVDTFTTTALGRPGQRVFYLQIRQGDQRVTVKCEKQQAAAIAEYLRKVMNDLPTPASKPLPTTFELNEPVDVTFVLGPIGLGYDRENDRLLVQLEEALAFDENGEVDENAAEDRGQVRLLLQRGQALAFCEHTEVVVAAGRPTCMFCGRPNDPDGHPCPRMN